MKKLILAALVLAAPAFAADPAAKTTDTKATGRGAMAPLPYDEKGLIERLHDDNQREIALGKLAQQKATNQATKDFAAMMVREHEQADKDLMALASKMKIQPGKPAPASDKERKKVAYVESAKALLEAADGPMFDSYYMANMVSDHDKAVFMVTRGMEKFSANQELATLLKQLQPKLIEHREHAYRTLGQVRVDQQAGVGGAGLGSGSPDHKGH